MTLQEFPKMIYGPNGQYVIVDDAEQEAEQMAEWSIAEPVELVDETDHGASRPAWPRRPRKVA